VADEPTRTRVLVIDDEANFTSLLRDFLEFRGCEVTVAGGGLEGFRQASRHRFDVITVDINMPGVNGVEALRSMQMVGQPAKAIVISGFLSDEVAAECRSAGAAAVLTKPVELARLGEIIGDLVGRKL
jgi:CheY-like chemotaxis protein